MTTMTSIPQPPTIPFLGNAHLIDKDIPTKSLMLLSKEYGSIYKLSLPGGRGFIVVSNYELIDQICDQKRFHKTIKTIKGTLTEVRNLTGDGLFTSHHGEKNWGIAHRILMPAFGPAKIRGMFPAMTDIASQLLAKFGPDYAIDATDDFTRLTFDTIALCAMSYRLNSFYSLELVPFITSMGSFLVECGRRSQRPALVQNYLVPSVNAQFVADQKVMMDITHEIVRARKEHPSDVDDLLNLMLTAKDPETGEGLSDQNIAYNLVTFLIAGHETTSGLLSLTISHLLNNPSAYAKVRAEVDEVLGKEPIRIEHLNKLTYITAVLRETLRLTPSVPAFGIEAFKNTDVDSDGKTYTIPAGTPIRALVVQMHRDTKIWGPDADIWCPERMLDGGFESAPKNAWKPWGNGVRACIGRPLAWQESLIAVASIFQKFDLVLDDPDYKLHIKPGPALKPKDLRIHAKVREALRATALPPPTEAINGVPLYLAYGSNSGTCKDFAQRISTEAPAKGFNPHVVTMNFLASSIPSDGPVIVITATYEGEPADNAGHFVEALKRTLPSSLPNVRFAVFGCGHHDWVKTYQKIPTLVDDLLGEAGAQRLLGRAAADSGTDEFFDMFDNWVPTLWVALEQAYGAKVSAKSEVGETLSVEMTSTTRATVLKREETSGLGTVIESRVLTKPGVPMKQHIEIALPENAAYNSGDYLAVLPSNPAESVKRVIHRFGLLPDQQVVIRSKASTTLPVDTPISVSERTATRKNIQDLMTLSSGETTRKLKSLTINYKSSVLDKYLSVLDILESNPDIEIPLATFLALLPAMRVRQYSISSSPLWNPEHATLTLSVVEKPTGSGRPGKFLGVASNYLASLQPGDRIHVGVRPSSAAFHLPEDISTPIVLFASGSGIAPMRGFIQERAIQAALGRQVGKTILFYGCRAPDEDYLYSESEFREWIKLGFLEVRPAFSRAVEQSGGSKYVQDRVWSDRDVVVEAYKLGAKLYTCGSPGVSNGIKAVVIKLIKETMPSYNEEQVESAFERIQTERMATDVFA
ncbi:bifunctional P-450:NADPH-P450 reductase [Ramaria rubella]|nr:bifunctional P-450:NADPH-P450 reductase [Ramaria rubella]